MNGMRFASSPSAMPDQDLARRLRRHVDVLAGSIGPRSTSRYPALVEAARYIEAELSGSGYGVRRQPFEAGGHTVWNVEAERTGGSMSAGVLVIGAHYDTVPGSPGANDNASGVAATLELARLHAVASVRDTVRFVAFVNEEPPHFMTETMGSLVYARRCAERAERVVGMLSLETIGYYSNAPGSQKYPPPLHLLFPDRGNFIGLVANARSSRLLWQVLRTLRGATPLRAIGTPAPEGIPGVSWSDHWSFWQQGYPAIMLTDTAPYRYPHYHSAADTPDKLDYPRMAQLVTGLCGVIARLAGSSAVRC